MREHTSLENITADSIRTEAIISYGIKHPPKCNLHLAFGDGAVILDIVAKRNIRNKIKYWLFCKFFPFKITRWD